MHDHVPASRPARQLALILAENDDIDFIAVALQPQHYAVSLQTRTLDDFLALRSRLIANDGYTLPLVGSERGALSHLGATSGFHGSEARLAIHLGVITSAETLREIGVLQ